jgi:chemosensory pili system protein ChpC
MSTRQLANKDIEELATLLIPIENNNLILPNVSVAEIFDYTEPTVEEDVPTWYLGMLTWRKIRVPLISFEAINDQPFFSKNGGNKISIINGTVDSDRMPFWGIVTQGAPRLMRVSAQEIVEEKGASTGPAELMTVSVSGELASIPDISWIEQQLLQLN